jgi:hypothetical protein
VSGHLPILWNTGWAPRWNQNTVEIYLGTFVRMERCSITLKSTEWTGMLLDGTSVVLKKHSKVLGVGAISVSGLRYLSFTRKCHICVLSLFHTLHTNLCS